MKIAYFTHYSAMYGATQSLFSLILEVRKKGIVPIVICPSEGELTEKLKEKKIQYYAIPFKSWVSKESGFIRRVTKHYYNFFISTRILKVIKKINVELLHTNSSVISIGAEIARLLRVPHIWHIREMLEENYNVCYESGFVKATNYINRNSSKVICISEAVYKKYKDAINSEKITVIYNGIDERKIVYSERQLPTSQAINLIITGLFIEEKRQSEALRASSILVHKYGMNCKLHVVGDGPQLGDLQRLAIQLGVGNYTRFYGYISRGKMEEVRANSHIALVCSKNEAFGRVTIEAQLAGIPVIGANTGGTVELIRHKEKGLLYNYGSPEDLALKISELFKHKNLYKIIQKNARENALLRYTAEKNAANIMSIYRDVPGNLFLEEERSI